MKVTQCPIAEAVKRVIALNINVTSDDIFNGKKGNCRECPVALAMIRALTPLMGDAAFEVRALNDKLHIVMYSGNYHYEAHTPTTFSRFMRAVDSGARVGPVRATVTFFPVRKLGA